MRPYQALMPDGNVTHLAGIGGYMIFFFIGEMINRYQASFKSRVLSIKLLIPLGVAWLIRSMIPILSSIQFFSVSNDLYNIKIKRLINCSIYSFRKG